MTYAREALKDAGYTHRGMYLGGHILENSEGKLELWNKSKHYAGYALIYKNTHLEFVSSLKRETVEHLLQ